MRRAIKRILLQFGLMAVMVVAFIFLYQKLVGVNPLQVALMLLTRQQASDQTPDQPRPKPDPGYSEFATGVNYELGRGVQKNIPEAARHYQIAAGQGSWKAATNLGFIYRDGAEGIVQNSAEAARLFKQAADAGDPAAQIELGIAYETDAGVPLDLNEAVTWYRKATDRGDKDAQDRLGGVYYNARNYAEAIKWYRMAAQQGYAHAQTRLGYIYLEGLGAPKDQNAAQGWYHKAADQGDVVAMHTLGHIYLHSVPPDYAEAMHWYHEAANKGFSAGQMDVGVMYWNGNGTRPDFVQAMMWLMLADADMPASDQDRPLLAENIAKLSREMTQGQINAARSLAQSWKPQ